MSNPSLSIERLFSLQGKVALVTGGSRGIGRMIAQGFLEAGAKVYISARKAPECEQPAQELREYGKCIAIPADVTDPKANARLIQAIGDAEKAGIAVYLGSRAGAYTHGTVIPVDGGTSINHQHARDEGLFGAT